MFLRNCWYVAAWTHEVPEASPIGRRVIGEPVVLFRSPDGAISALADRCAHRHAPLSMGRIEEAGLRCMYHGLVFDRDGDCVSVPGSTAVPPNCSVRRYPVIVRDSWVWIWPGDPARADPALVPQAIGLDNPDLVMRSGEIDYRANYMLINDNLCDLSHVDFVHENTLGLVSGGGWSDEVPRVMPTDRGLRIERWFVGKPASPSNPTLVDTWSTYDYLVPGIFVMTNKSYPAGMAEQCGRMAPEEKPMTYRVEQQAVTPLSDTETRYFFATGFDAKMPAKLLDGIFTTVMDAFTEDRLMIEAQQRIWEVTPPGEPMAFIAHDKGPSMFRRIMSRMEKAEAHEPAPAAA